MKLTYSYNVQISTEIMYFNFVQLMLLSISQEADAQQFERMMGTFHPNKSKKS